jgi:hypothetical protein
MQPVADEPRGLRLSDGSEGTYEIWRGVASHRLDAPGLELT